MPEYKELSAALGALSATVRALLAPPPLVLLPFLGKELTVVEASTQIGSKRELPVPLPMCGK